MKKIICILMFMLGINPSFAQTIDDLKFFTEEYPPYNFYGPDGKLQGMAIDLLGEVLDAMGSKRSVQETNLVPWTEVYRSLIEEKNIIGFATSRSETREKLFKWAGPIIFSRTVAIGKKGGKKLKDKHDLKNYKVAVIKNDVGHHVGRLLEIPENNFVIALNMNEIISAMENNEADFWIYEDSVIQWYLKQIGKVEDYEVAEILEANNLSYAFSKDVPDKLVIEFQEALDEVKSSDLYFDILDKYTK